MASTGAGLEGVVATSSQICFIDGEQGVLSYFGYNIHTLAEKATFEETIYLLWNGKLPTESQLSKLKQSLVAERELPGEVTAFLRSAPKEALPMDVVRTAVSMLSLYDPIARDNSTEANVSKAVKLMARIATIVTSYDRLRNKQETVTGDPSLGYAANFLYTLTGKRPDDVLERVFDIALTLHADHELNASTFAARVTASTLSDIYSAVTSAIGALKGPLHGGANEDVIRLLLSTNSPDDAVRKVKELLDNKVKIAGFGHRVYKTLDPRAIHLKKLSQELGERTGHAELFEKSARVEQTVPALKKLVANVDFYSASTYYSLGIPVDLFTPIFAGSRMSGWTAHILEQYRNNRLIRPRAEYTGFPDGQQWTSIGQRS